MTCGYLKQLGCVHLWAGARDRNEQKLALTSAGRLATVGAIPFSVLTLPELLLGELGAEPGALLLHAESVGRQCREPQPGPEGAGHGASPSKRPHARGPPGPALQAFRVPVGPM